jgi:hypothetical protein
MSFRSFGVGPEADQSPGVAEVVATGGDIAGVGQFEDSEGLASANRDLPPVQVLT